MSFLFFLLFGEKVSAATYYVCDSGTTCNASSSGWVTGNNSNTCTTRGTACKTFVGAWGKMSAGGGNTIIFGDGTYIGTNNTIGYSSYPPYGNAGAYNVFKAEHDGGVIFDGAGVILDYPSGNRNYYWQFEGLVWGNTNFTVSYGNHIKVLRCGGYNAGSGNVGQFEIMRGMSYVLIEDSYAWGSGRYKFLAYGRYSDVGATQTNNIIFRRVVARMDQENAGGEPIAGIAMYSVKNSLVQNAIVIDSDTQNYWTNLYSRNGCFYVPTTNDPANNITIENSVCLNSQFGGVAIDDAASGVVVKNNVFWKVNIDSGEWANYSRGKTTSWTNNTFGVSTQNETYTSGYNSSGFQITNNLFYGIGGGGIIGSWGNVTHDYNTYYGSSGLPTLSTHEYNNHNPIWNASSNPTGALKYITRIEMGSNHSGAGSGGVDIGANILKKVGASGTLWGETGYDIEQTESLWPFPNESLIKAKMAAYTYPGINGARGFAASGNGLYGGPITLTSYIWEYLGNPCPNEICLPTPSTSTPCNTVTTANFSQSTYNSYGAPFDPFTSNTPLVNVTCNSADTDTISLTTGVTGDTTRIVYTKGYWYDAVTTAWRQYTGTCTGALNGEWCQGSVSATITDTNVSTASAGAPTYLVGMTCSVQGGNWKCGCRDTSCTNFSWQIQGAGQ